MLAAPKGELVESIRSTARFGKNTTLATYDAICVAAKDAAVFGPVFPSNAPLIRLHIKTCREYQAHPDNMLEELYKVVDKLEGTPVYDRNISKRFSRLAKRILHMVALNNLKVNKRTKHLSTRLSTTTMPTNAEARRKSWLSGLSCIKSATSFFPCSRIINHLRSLLPKNTVSSI